MKNMRKILLTILCIFTYLLFTLYNTNLIVYSTTTPEIEVYFTNKNGKKEFNKEELDYFEDDWGFGSFYGVQLDLYLKANNTPKDMASFQIEIHENDLLESIAFVDSEKTPTPPYAAIWNTNSSSSDGDGLTIAVYRDGRNDTQILTEPTKIATVYFVMNPEGPSDVMINYDLIVSGYNNGTNFYDESIFTLNPIIVGDPNSTPDASLSSLDITGNTTNQIYDFNVDAEEIDGIIKNQIMISYQDSINGLTINPIFNKSSLGSSNCTIEESRLDGNNYYNGDTIKIVTTDGDDSKTYMIKVLVEEPAIETGINLSLQAGDSGTISFNNDENRYEIVTPFIETDIKVLASTIDPNATLNQTELSFIGLKQEEWTEGVFIVTAEDGTTYKEYPVFAMRQKGSSNANIKIETNEFPNGIEPEGNNFIFNYDENKQSISFRIIKEHIAQSIRVREVGSNYTNYTEGLITKNQIQTKTTYSYEILVTPESGFEDEIVKYQVDFIIAKSSDTSLKTGSIKVKEDGFDEIIIDNNNLL